MAARPTVTVQSTEAEGAAGSTVAMPAVLLAPIRPDVVHDVHKDMAKNNRQAYSVSWMAGMQTPKGRQPHRQRTTIRCLWS